MRQSIVTPRLILAPMTVAFLTAALAEDQQRASAELGAQVPRDWVEANWLIQLRLSQLESDPALQPWLLRAIIHRTQKTMIGHIGFHDYPGAAYLHAYATAAAEMGYTIFPAHRRQGYAREAVAALMAWAETEQGVTQFVLSISPDNLPSQRIAAHFGFQRVGQWEDAEDGTEDVFLRIVK
ncbi:MAG: GNAT family N-acetyltransferase [Caldilineaceae bacterium]